MRRRPVFKLAGGKFEIYENRLAGPSFRVVALERNIVEHNIIKLG